MIGDILRKMEPKTTKKNYFVVQYVDPQNKQSKNKSQK